MQLKNIRNVCPRESLGGKTPYEAITGKRPHYKSIHVFGVPTWYWVKKEDRKGKLANSGARGFFLSIGENLDEQSTIPCCLCILDATTRAVKVVADVEEEVTTARWEEALGMDDVQPRQQPVQPPQPPMQPPQQQPQQQQLQHPAAFLDAPDQPPTPSRVYTRRGGRVSFAPTLAPVTEDFELPAEFLDDAPAVRRSARLSDMLAGLGLPIELESMGAH